MTMPGWIAEDTARAESDRKWREDVLRRALMASSQRPETGEVYDWRSWMHKLKGDDT